MLQSPATIIRRAAVVGAGRPKGRPTSAERAPMPLRSVTIPAQHIAMIRAPRAGSSFVPAAAADGRFTNHHHARLATRDREVHLFELSSSKARSVTFITPLNHFPVAAMHHGKLEVRVIARSDAGARHEQVVTLLEPG